MWALFTGFCAGFIFFCATTGASLIGHILADILIPDKPKEAVA